MGLGRILVEEYLVRFLMRIAVFFEGVIASRLKKIRMVPGLVAMKIVDT